jgi:hypothetical protein
MWLGFAVHVPLAVIAWIAVDRPDLRSGFITWLWIVTVAPTAIALLVGFRHRSLSAGLLSGIGAAGAGVGEFLAVAAYGVATSY